MDEQRQDYQDETNDLVVNQDSFNGINSVSTAIPPKGPDGSIVWTASEFIRHEKNFKWYLWLGLGTAIVSALVWFLTKDVLSTLTMIVAGMVLGIVANKKPRTMEYKIDKEGLQINGKNYSFDQFRSFAIVHEGAFSSLVFIPLRRFALLTTAYYDPVDESKIIDLLSSVIPIEEKKRDWLEALMWKIRY